MPAGNTARKLASVPQCLLRKLVNYCTICITTATLHTSDTVYTCIVTSYLPVPANKALVFLDNMLIEVRKLPMQFMAPKVKDSSSCMLCSRKLASLSMTKFNNQSQLRSACT